MRNADMPYAFMIENQRARNKKRTEYGLRIIGKNVWQKTKFIGLLCMFFNRKWLVRTCCNTLCWWHIRPMSVYLQPKKAHITPQMTWRWCWWCWWYSLISIFFEWKNRCADKQYPILSLLCLKWKFWKEEKKTPNLSDIKTWVGFNSVHRK